MESNLITLKTENLCKSFGDLVAVENLSVEIRKGEIFGLLGPNGAGKTTSIKMITGLLKPDRGVVTINGEVAGETDNRQNVGICPQELVLWNNLTCFEQLVFIASMYKVPRKTSKIRAMELLEKMGLQEKQNKLVKTLSGGMQRRMNILMALMHDPEILILDEPEAGLDPQSRVMVREFIQSMAKTKTIVFTTHNMDEADRLCNRIAIIDHGKMLVTDTPENLKRTFGKGDKLEITFSGDAPDFDSLAFLADEVRIEGQTIFLFSKGIIEKLPAILDQLKHLEVSVSGIHLSENTLEDVFISLTGRKLRE
jgi:ABC-2 type transport system ATP-binding protein